MLNKFKALRSLKIVKKTDGRYLTTITPAQKLAIENCVTLVKEHDISNYYAGILLPNKYRSCFFAIRAFDVEISQIKEQSRRNTMTGMIKLHYSSG